MSDFVPPPLPPRDFSTPVRPPCRARPPSSCRACPPSLPLRCAVQRGCSLVTWMPSVPSLCLHDDAPNWRAARPRRLARVHERRRTRPRRGNWRRPDLGGDWHARRTSKWCEGKKRASAIGEKKIGGEVHTLGLPSLNAKSLGVGLFLDFANEFGTLQTTPNAKFICKIPWRCLHLLRA